MITNAMPNHWVVTCNPKRWDIWAFLDEGSSVLDIEGWSVVQHLQNLNQGDDIALWVTGADRGIYAIGTIKGEPAGASGDEYWVEDTDRRRPRSFVPLRFTTDLTQSPILGSELKGDPRFADATVITFPRGGNPHRLSGLQWEAITDRI